MLVSLISGQPPSPGPTMQPEGPWRGWGEGWGGAAEVRIPTFPPQNTLFSFLMTDLMSLMCDSLQQTVAGRLQPEGFGLNPNCGGGGGGGALFQPLDDPPTLLNLPDRLIWLFFSSNVQMKAAVTHRARWSKVALLYPSLSAFSLAHSVLFTTSPFSLGSSPPPLPSPPSLSL